MRARQDGQATVELVALLPCVVAVLAAVWQVVLAGEARWSAATAARAAARAAAVGGDAEAAARRHLPWRLEPGLRVSDTGDGRVRVTLAVPAVIDGLRPGHTSAEASFTPQEPR